MESFSMKEYKNSDSRAKESKARRFIDSFSDLGFATIKDTKFDVQLENKLYLASEVFFNSNQEVKNKYSFPELHGQRGYTKPLVETACGASIPDLKEFWQYGRDPKGVFSDWDGFYKNPDLSSFQEFSNVMKDVYEVLNTIALDVMEVVSLGLDINYGFFSKYLSYGNSILRVLNYLPVSYMSEVEGESGGGGDVVWSRPHTDINLITLLIGATNKGLQIKSCGEFIEYGCEPGEIVVNVGDMLSRLTNDVLPSTVHRVCCPDDLTTTRMSAPFFLHPEPNMPLDVLPRFVRTGESPLFDDILAGEFLNQRLVEIGLR